MVAAGQAGQVHVVGDPRGRGQLRGRRQRPVGDQREQHPLHHRIPPACRPASRRSRVSIPSRCHSRSSSHAPPSGRDSTNASPGTPTARARSGPDPRRRLGAQHPGQRGDQPLDRGAGRADRRGRRSTAPSSASVFAAGSHSLCANCRYDTRVPSGFRRVDVRTNTPPDPTRAAAAHSTSHGRFVLPGLSGRWTRSQPADQQQPPRSCTRSPISCGTQARVRGLSSHTRMTRTVRLRNDPYQRQTRSVICTVSVRP